MNWLHFVGFAGLDLSQVLVISAGFYGSEEGVSNRETINEALVADLGIKKEVESGNLGSCNIMIRTK